MSSGLSLPVDNVCRLQIVVYYRLVAEVVGRLAYVDRCWGEWCVSRWRAGLPMGGSVITGAGGRLWRVPVGACVQCGSLEACEHGEVLG